MSSGNIPYHLRPNKYIERALFVELLSKICGQRPSASYAYISMGGPQLEDHKLIHQSLGLESLFSFESEKNVHNRQLFNQRPSCLKCFNEPINEFVDKLEQFLAQEKIENKKLIIWLDYAMPDRRQQLLEYQTLVSKLQEQDIVKVTLNANINTFGERQSGETHEAVQERRLEKITRDIADYLPSEISSDMMTSKRIIPILCNSIEVATEKGLSSRPRVRPVLLSLFAYKDGYHQMLTATILLTNSSDTDRIKSEVQWDYFPQTWTDVKSIDVPSLTAKERLEIDSRLPTNDVDKLHDSLPFMLDTDDLNRSKELLREYAKHYRRYPSYFQVIL